MLLLVTIDLSAADVAMFETYEFKVLRLLPKYGARLELRVRALDGAQETHLLYFPDAAAYDAYRADPARVAVLSEWERCGAKSVRVEVERVGG